MALRHSTVHTSYRAGLFRLATLSTLTLLHLDPKLGELNPQHLMVGGRAGCVSTGEKWLNLDIVTLLPLDMVDV